MRLSDPSDSFDPVRTVRENATLLFRLIDGLEHAGFEHLTSRYKPLTLLWAMGRIVSGKPRLLKWHDFRDEMPDLKQRYGRALPTSDPQYPFWDLRTSGLWEVIGLDNHPRRPYAPSLELLDSADPSAGLLADVATLLEDRQVHQMAVERLTSRFFLDVDRTALLADLGLSALALRAHLAVQNSTDSTSATESLDGSNSSIPAQRGGGDGGKAQSRREPMQATPSADAYAGESAEVSTDVDGQQGRQQDSGATRAIELYAEDLAVTHFEQLGWTVKRVGQLKLGFDLDCFHPNEGALHVEVKGTQTMGGQVILTPNEVRHNRSGECMASHALYIVSEIRLTRAGMLRCSGGRQRCLWPWKIDAGSLTPSQYVYTLPQSSPKPASRV